MKQDSLPGWTIPFLTLILLLALACNWMVWSHWDPTLTMNDGIGYLSTASNWLKGNGFSTNALIYIPHFEGRMPAHETVWPIGYPATIAVASLTGLSLQAAALSINLLAQFLSAILIYTILRRCAVVPLVALGVAIAFYFTTEGWILVVTLLSEPLFALLVLTTLTLLPDSAAFTFRRLLICAVLLALATTVRYSGAITAVSFAAGMGLVCLWHIRSTGFSGFLWQSAKLAVFCLIALGGYAALQFRIYNISGNIDRDTGTGEIHSVADTVRLFAEQSSVMTGFRDGGLFQGDTDKWAFIAFVIAIIIISFVALFSYVRRQSAYHEVKTPTGREHYTAIVVCAILMHTLLYAGYLFYCRLSESPLPVSARYLYQLYPGLLIVFGLLVNRAIVSTQARPTAKNVVLATIAALLALFALAQVNLISAIDEFTRRGDDAAAVLTLPVSEDKTVGDLVSQCVGDAGDRAIWSNEGVMLHGSTGANTVTYTGIYANRPFDTALLATQIKDYHIVMFMFINNNLARQGQYAERLQTARAWLLDNQYQPVALNANTVDSGTSLDILIDTNACGDALTTDK
jgi:hypothetical protein